MIKNMELCPRKIKTKILKIKSKYFSRLSLNERFRNFIVINSILDIIRNENITIKKKSDLSSINFSTKPEE